uniref:Uncharacterized protein n=1 Tax=Vitis vinifera TaxID=29760 RepID=A5B3W6_VITVI|nr:hypothetical protein VITISV_031748 [Vitis vinifera]
MDQKLGVKETKIALKIPFPRKPKKLMRQARKLDVREMDKHICGAILEFSLGFFTSRLLEIFDYLEGLSSGAAFQAAERGTESGLLSGGRWDGVRSDLLRKIQNRKKKKRKKEEDLGGLFGGEQARGLNFLERPAVTEREKNSLRGSKLGSFGLRSPDAADFAVEAVHNPRPVAFEHSRHLSLSQPHNSPSVVLRPQPRPYFVISQRAIPRSGTPKQILEKVKLSSWASAAVIVFDWNMRVFGASCRAMQL